jgi:formate-dependent nitrite reductase membrane component NrfD
MKSTNILLFSAIWAFGHIIVALLFIYFLLQSPYLFNKLFWSSSFAHFCWLEMARTYMKRNF